MKYNDENWEHILYDTWHHDTYYDLMCSILWKKFPVEKHESTVDMWWEEKTFTAEEMRDVIQSIEYYWKDKVSLLLIERDGLREDINNLELALRYPNGGEEE